MMIQKKGQYYTVGRYKLDNYQDAVKLSNDLTELKKLKNTTKINPEKIQKHLNTIKNEIHELEKEVKP